MRYNRKALLKGVGIQKIKAKQFTDFSHAPIPNPERQKYQAKRENILNSRKQGSLIDDGLRDAELVSAPDYRFYYHFDDLNGKNSKMMIADWEIQALYRNCLRGKNKQQALEDVRKKYSGGPTDSNKTDFHF